MYVNSFFKGVSVGIIAGAAISMAMNPQQNRKKFMKTNAGRAMKNVGDVIGNIADVISR